MDIVILSILFPLRPIYSYLRNSTFKEFHLRMHHRNTEFNEHVFKKYQGVLLVACYDVILWQMMSCTVATIQKKILPLAYPSCCSWRSYNIILMQKSRQWDLIDLIPNSKLNEVKGIFPLSSVISGASWFIVTALLYF